MASAPPEPRGSHVPPPAPAARAGAFIGLIALFTALSMVILAAFVILGILIDETEDDDRRLSGRGAGPTRTHVVEVAEFFVEPGVIEVSAGTHLIVNVTNTGELVHDLSLNGEIGTDRLQPGGSQTVDLGVIDATAQAWCTVPGHRDAGMVMTITVTEPLPSGG